MKFAASSVSTLALILTTPVAIADSVTINPSRDNTLIETDDGSLSNGAAQQTFSGRTNFFGGETARRAVTAFDIAGAVPAGSTITSVSLKFILFMGAPTSGNETHTLHRLTANWGEGASDFPGGAGAPSEPGDATWIHTFFPTTNWATAGGDFDPAVSGTAVIGSVPLTEIIFSDAAMTADVQGWLDAPATSFGWIMIGNEAVPGTAKSFFSKEATDAPFRPELTIEFEPGGPACTGDTNNDGSVDVSDLVNVITLWGTDGQQPGIDADTNNDGTVAVGDLTDVILNWGDCP